MNGTESKGRKIWVLILIDHELAWNDELYPSNRIVMQLTPNCFYSLEKAKFCFFSYIFQWYIIDNAQEMVGTEVLYVSVFCFNFDLSNSWFPKVLSVLSPTRFELLRFICYSKYFSNWCDRLSDPTPCNPWSKLPSMANNICM